MTGKQNKNFRNKLFVNFVLIISVLLTLFSVINVLPVSADTNYALQFNGTSNYISLGRTNELFGSSNWTFQKTISLWIYPGIEAGPATIPTSGALILGIDRPRTFAITRANYDGSDRIWVWNADADGVDMVPVDFTPLTWMHLAIVHDGVQLLVYKDGQLVGAINSGATFLQNPNADGTLSLAGSGRNNSYMYFSGQLDEVRFWNATLDQATIQVWKDQELTNTHPNYASLAAYYKMNSGTGTTILDTTGIQAPALFSGGMDNTNWVLSGAFANPVNTATPTATYTPIPATSTPTNTPPPATPTNTPLLPTATPTNTAIPPTATNTPLPPTATPTNTAIPPTATSTPLSPTATPTNTTIPPTATSTPLSPTATPTNTVIPPTATNTPLPPTATPTSTSFAPTATNTPLPPTVTFTPTNTQPPSNNAGFALSFDGVNDYGVIGQTGVVMGGTSWQDTMSFSLWVKPIGAGSCDYNSVAHCDSILGDRPRWWGLSHGTLDGVDRLWAWNYDGTYEKIGIPYTAGEWVHITWVHSGGTLSVYKNGVLIDAVPSGTTMQPNTGASPRIQVGGVINNTTRNWSFQGEIDEIRLFNIGLTQSEIQATMYSELSGSENGLRAYYKMSDGSGTVVTDDSINDFTIYLFDGGGIVPANGSYPLWVISTAPITGTSPAPTPTATATPTSTVAGPTPTATNTPIAPTPTATTAPVGGNPVEIGSLVTDGAAYDLAVNGTTVYIADTWGGLKVVDASDPTLPVQVGSVLPDGRIYGVDHAGNYVYAANAQNGLLVYDVSNPGNPVMTGSIDTPGYAWDLTVQNNLVYLADRTGGLRIIDVNDPYNPVETGSIATSNEAIDVAVQNDLAYVAIYSDGLQIIDVSNPAAPVNVGNIVLDRTYGVKVIGNTAYVADGGSGLKVVDVSNPSQPVLEGSYPTAGWSRSTWIDNSTVYMANWNTGLSVLDISDISQIQQIGTYVSPDMSRDVIAANSVLYLADYGGGLRVLAP